MAKRKVKPKFFVFIAAFLLIIAAGVFLALKLKDRGKEDAAVIQATPVPTPPAEATPTPDPHLPENLTVHASSDANPSLFGFSSGIEVAREEVSSYTRKEPVAFGHPDEYTDAKGILTFGGNNYRNTFSYGTVDIQEQMLRKSWEQSVGGIGSWTGTGWTGEPLIICWSAEVRAVLGVSKDFKEKEDFTEVIYPAMDGKIYFFELTTGTKTREPINLGVVVKSTPCLDPHGWPMLYVGQSIQSQNDKKLSVAYVHAISLITNEEVARFGGHDYFSYREWQAYDSSPIIVDDTLVYAGENGVLYTSKLNTSFNAEEGTVSINPERLVKYNYTGNGYSDNDTAGKRWYGIESSVAGYGEYVYFTDNGGRLQCVNLNSMSLEFVADVNEDADATVVIDESYQDNTIYLYCASQVKYPTMEEKYGYTYHRCIDGLTGALKWEQKWIASSGDENSSGGTLATPQVGRGNVSNLVFYSMNLTALSSITSVQKEPSAQNADGEQEEQLKDTYTLGGKIVAYNKRTGETVWTIEQTADYWSSPVLVYSESGRGFLLQCDRDGYVKLYDALSGSELSSINLGSRIDSTPAVFGNYLVVGTRGKGGNGDSPKIACVKIN